MKTLLHTGGLLLSILVLAILALGTIGGQRIHGYPVLGVPFASTSSRESSRPDWMSSETATPALDPVVRVAQARVPDTTSSLPAAAATPALTTVADDNSLQVARRETAATHKPAVTTSPSDYFSVFVHVPPDVPAAEPLWVLLVLHGMGGNGAAFAQPLIAAADRYHWLLIAPTMPYVCDYFDANQLSQEDLALTDHLDTLIRGLPARLGLKLRRHVVIFGFSRGAQIAHRFALLHPDDVEAVAAISAGSYTMPYLKSSDKVLAFPYGIGDLQQRVGKPFEADVFSKVSFWVAVGGKDNRPSDVSRSFDPYGGRTRLERAQAFEAALHRMGLNAYLRIFPNADHEVTAEMRESAVEFLVQDVQTNHWDD